MKSATIERLKDLIKYVKDEDDEKEFKREVFRRLSSIMGDIGDWNSMYTKIPYFSLPEGWSICIFPPFGGADARFMLKKGSVEISIFLDCRESLGYHKDGAYYEILGDTHYRIPLAEAERIPKICEAILELEEATDY